MKKKLFALITITALSLTPICAKEDCFIVKKDGGKIKVDRIEADDKGILTYSSGKFKVKIKPDDYKYAWIPKPSSIIDAEKKLHSKDYAAAASAFKTCYSQYKYLGYDVLCVWGEASCLYNLDKKEDVIEKLKSLEGYKLEDPQKQSAYYDAKKLLANAYIDLNRRDDAYRVLSELDNSSDDNIAAWGFVARGDILTKQGKKKEAVLMYMKTALLFPKTNMERPGALCNIANLLKQMNDNRASKFAEMLKNEYPGSPYINKLE